MSDDKIQMLNEYLDNKKATRIDLNQLLSVLTYLKELDLMNEKETEGDEYCKLNWKIIIDSGCICSFGGRA